MPQALPTGMMGGMTCLVETTGRDPRLIKARNSPFHRAKDGLTTLSASGILLPAQFSNHQIVLSPASVIWPFLNQTYRHNLDTASQAELLPGTHISIITTPPESSNTYQLGYVQTTGLLLGFLSIPKLLQVSGEVKSSMPFLGWPLGRSSQLKVFRSTAIIRMDRPLLVLSHELSMARGKPSMEVQVIGAPFGCISKHHFMNCVVNGILLGHNNLIKCVGCLSISGYFLPGMEGGLVVTRDASRILGVMSLPINGTPFLVPLDLILQELHLWCVKRRGVDFAIPQSFNIFSEPQTLPWILDTVADVGKSVVKVRTATGAWGSGVVINHKTGTIMTCSHIFGGHGNTKKNEEVNVFFPGAGWHKGAVMHRFGGFLDVALAQLSVVPPLVEAAKLWDGDFGSLRGRTCYAVGFGAEKGGAQLNKPGICKGNIAKVVCHPGKKDHYIMLISAVPVFPGSSGGALCLATGQLVGLITGNALHTGNKSTTHCTFSIPVCLLKDINEWGQERCTKDLDDLDVVDIQASRVWNLLDPADVPVEQEPGGQAFKAFLRKYSRGECKDRNPNQGRFSKL